MVVALVGGAVPADGVEDPAGADIGVGQDDAGEAGTVACIAVAGSSSAERSNERSELTCGVVGR
jgi:hypothetical protein